MADNLIFPIGFDLEAAVKEAGAAWDAKYAKKIEDLIAKRPVNVKIKIDTLKLDSLEAVKKRLAELKIEPVTRETKAAIKELAAELRTLAKALEQVQKYSTGRVTSSPDAVRAARINEINKRAEEKAEKARAAAARASQAELKLEQARLRAANAATRGAEATKRANQEFHNQDGYISRLVKRLAVYAGYREISGFIANIRKVTAEFELQRVSLGAIIQDQTRANALFSEIKSFALKSPVSILDLTKYTKQLAAYKIGVDELFETTKKLTDVSVGLGVSMDRVVLAFGQTRATGYLRASEIRQFTEMGVPIVEELAAKLSKMNGELITAAQVMDMVSKRGISFELVKEVFDDMTSAGGMFYNMQEKQGNTLFGLWAKLGDAASVMYDEIGNTTAVNTAMKDLIQILTDLMRNWREVGRLIGAAGMAFATIWSAKKIKGLQSGIDAAADAARKKATAAEYAYARAVENYNAARLRGNMADMQSARVREAQALTALKAARAEMVAANATTLWGKAWNSLKAAFLGNWVSLVIMAVAAIGVAIYNSMEKANRLKNSLKEIAEESGIEQMKSVRNFESLANVAVNAADGSRKQKEALDELSRTYKDIIPQERLTIENLRDMKGNYDSVTQSIKDYVAEQMKQKQVNSILEITGKEMIEKSREIQDIMKDIWSSEQIARYMTAYEQIIRDNPAIFAAEAMKKAAEDTGIGWENMLGLGAITRDKLAAALRSFSKTLKEQVTQVNALEVAWSNNYAALGRYGIEYEKMANKIKDNPISVGGSPNIDENKTPYLFKQQQQNLEILQAMIPTLKKIMSDANVTWQDGWANIVTTIDEAQPQIISSIDFDAINKYLKENLGALDNEQRMAINKLQGLYYNLGIPEEVVRHNRQIAIDLANSMNEALSKLGNGSRSALDNVTKYFQTSGQSVNDYVKTLQDALKALKARIAEIEAVGLLMSAELRKELEDKKIEAELLTKLIDRMSTAVTSDKSKKTTSDNRLQTLNEIEQTLTKINQKYEELLKKEGQTKALADIQKIYGDTLKYINSLGEKFKLTFDMPTDFTSLQDYRKAIQKVIETLKMKGHEKAALELQTKIDTGNIDQLQTQIDKKLKELSERISRTKTAREFYDKILSQTGDVDMAATLTMSIYGNEEGNIQELLAQQIQKYFGEYEIEIPVVTGTDIIDYKRVRELAKAAYDAKKIGYESYEALSKIASDGEKDLSKIAEQGTKLLLKFDEIAQQRVNIEHEASEKIRQLREAEAIFLASNASEQEKAAYKKRTDKAVAGVEADRDLGLLKLKDEYLRFFSAIHSLTNKEAETLRTQVRQSLFNAFQNGVISASQLKKEIKAVDEQFRKLKDDSGMVMDYLKGGFDGLIQRVHDTADELQSVAAEIAKMESPDQISEGQKSFIDKILGKFGNENTGRSFTDLFSKTNGDTKQMAANLQNCADGMEGMADGAANALAIVDRIITDVARTIEGIAAVRDQLNEMRSEDNQLSGGFWDAFEYLENFNKYAAKGWEDLKSGNLVGAVQNTVQSIISIFGTAQAQRVRRANKEIERQKNLVEDLEYVYGRLEKAADKAFGVDYGANYKKQLANLQAQQTAYLKMAEAERSKGKKADDAKIKEYENSARETADAIKELMEDLAQHFAGVSLTDAARQMAKSWIDAKASMSDTWAAIKDNYSEWIKNMIVEGAAARIVENALTPMWEQMDKRLQANDPEGAIKVIMDGMDAVLSDANRGLEVLWKRLEASGYNLKEMLGETNSAYSGIKREVAGATSEEMNANTAALNTQNYYLSQVPGIAANVALIRQYMESGNTTVTPTGWTDWQTQAMSNYEAVKKNTADTVVECRRAAVAAEAAVAELRRVITVKGSKHGFQVYM